MGTNGQAIKETRSYGPMYMRVCARVWGEDWPYLFLSLATSFHPLFFLLLYMNKYFAPSQPFICVKKTKVKVKMKRSHPCPLNYSHFSLSLLPYAVRLPNFQCISCPTHLYYEDDDHWMNPNSEKQVGKKTVPSGQRSQIRT